MKIALFGGTGKTGGLILKQALSAGHQITALVRDPTKLEPPHQRLRVVIGAANQPGAIADTVRGTAVVISAIGGGDGTLTTFGRNVIAAMERASQKRIVSLIGASVLVPGDRSSPGITMLRLITRLFGVSALLEDATDHVNELKASDLDYTLVRPPRLTDGAATGHIRHDFTLNLDPRSSISRADLAAFMLKVAVKGLYLRAAPMVAGLH
jgi:putative NADH-flavin reductase